MEAIHARPLGVHGSGLDLGFQRAFRLGLLPLRALGAAARHRLGVGARQRVGSGLGHLAGEPGPYRLGTAPSGNAGLARTHLGFLGRGHLRHRPLVVLVHQLQPFRKQHPAVLPACCAEHGLLPQHQERNALQEQLRPCLRRRPLLPDRERAHRQDFSHSPPPRGSEPQLRARRTQAQFTFQRKRASGLRAAHGC